MNRKVKCKFCRREIFLKDFRTHLRVIHSERVKEKIQEVMKVESIPELSLLSLFGSMELLQEDTRFNVSAGDLLAEEIFSGKGGESGGGGASYTEPECDEKCDSCESNDSDSGESDSGPSSGENE